MSTSSPSDRFESGEFDPSVIPSLLKGYRLTKPLIAAVEGPAIAGGTEILQATDIRVAGESARFGVSEPKWGLYPLGGSAVRLVRQLPYTVAADLLLTGRHIKAPEAKEIGLIGHVVPDGEALAKAHEIAALIAANGPLAVQAVLKTIRDSEGKHEDECWKDDAAVGAAVFASNDAKEGPRAFAEKRSPELHRDLRLKSLGRRRPALLGWPDDVGQAVPGHLRLCRAGAGRSASGARYWGTSYRHRPTASTAGRTSTARCRRRSRVRRSPQ